MTQPEDPAVSGSRHRGRDGAERAPDDDADRDDLHKVLLRRLQPFVDTAFSPGSLPPEVAAATEAGVCRDVADLAEASPDFESDMLALLCATAAFDWLAKTRADDNDLTTTLGLYRAMDRVNPDFAPPRVRELFGRLDPDADLYGLLGTSVLSAALRCADQDLIDSGVRLVRRALSRLPAADPGRVALLGSLAAAAHASDEFTGTEQSLATLVDTALAFAMAVESPEPAEVGSSVRDTAVDMLTDGLFRLVAQATGRSSLRRAVMTVKSAMAMRPSDSAAYVRLCVGVGAALTAQGVELADGPALREASRLALLALRQRAVTVAQTEPLLGIAGQTGSLLKVLGDVPASGGQEPDARAAALFAALEHRLSGYDRTGDVAMVLDDLAVKESTALLAIAHYEAASHGQVSLARAAALAGDLHWARFRERRRGQAPDDDPTAGASIVVIPHEGEEFSEVLLVLPEDPAGTAEANAAIAHYALLPPGDDEAVPAAIRTECSMIRNAADTMAALALRRSLGLLNEYDHGGDPGLARQALGKLARALCSPYADPQQRDFLAHRFGDALLCLYETDQDPDTLAASMAVLRRVAASPRISAGYRAEVLAALARAAVASYEGGGAAHALEQAVAWAREAVALDPATVPGRSVLATALLSGAPDPAALEESIALLRALADDPEDGAGPGDLANLGAALRMRARRSRSGADVAESISWARRAISVFSPGDIRSGLAWYNLAEALATLETPDAASERVSILTSLLGRTSPQDRYWTWYTHALGAALADTWHRSPRQEAARALADARAAVAGSRKDPDDRAAALAALSSAVLDANDLDADEWDIELLRSVLALAREAAGASATNILARLTLAKALKDLANATGDPVAMAEAGEQYRAALAQAGPDDRLYPMSQSAMGNYLLTQFENSGEPDLLQEAAQISRRAYETTATSHPHYPQILNNFTSVAVTVAEETTDASALPGLIEALRAALAAQHGDDEMADLLAGALVIAIHAAWYRGVPGTDLDDAVRMARETLIYAVSQIRHAKRLSTLGYLLREMHILRHEQAVLDESIAVLREALAISEAYGVTDTIIMQNLAASLGRRARQMGDSSALNEAVGLLRAAGEAAVGRPERGVILGTLGSFLASAGAATLPEGIGFLREVTEILPPGHHDRDRYLTAASSALHISYEVSGDRSQLDDAIRFGEEACAESGHAAVARSASLAQLAMCYQERARVRPNRDDISRAITLIGEAARILPPDSAALPARLRQMGTVYLDVADRSGNAEVLAQAASLFRAVARSDTADTEQRARSAQSWRQTAARMDDSSAALEAFSLAVELLDQVAWRGLEAADQERLIGRFAGAVRTAAAWALECGNAVRAVELLEQGRGVMLGRALEARTPFDELAAVAPDLADRLSQVLAELRRPFADPVADLPDMGPGRLARRQHGTAVVIRAEAASDRRIRLARERDELLAHVRTLAGFAGFLRSPRFEDLRAAAAGGPVVIVNIAALRCDALIITGDDVLAVLLPGLTEASVAEQAEAFTGCLVIMEGGRSDFDLSMTMGARQEVIKTLGWLWDSVSVPVLQALGISAPAADPPRLWWCPTGDLCFLPLHAAGRYARDGASAQSLLDYAVSSYTPTVGFLAGQVGMSRQQATNGPAQNGSALLIAAPAPARADAVLLSVSRDVAAFAAHFPHGLILADDAATAAAILDAIGDYQIVHFACHAQQHVRDPSSGFISAYDAPVTVRELRERTAPGGQVALLMGCETARGGRRLADEAITMATALQLAGFRHTVATLWSVDDTDAAAIAQHVYRATSMSHPDAPPPALSVQRLDTTTARAVHDAVQKLRAEYPFAPNRWASLVHLGP